MSTLKTAAVSRMSAAELRQWAASPSGRASLASLLKGAGPTVQPRAYVQHRETWGPGAGYRPAHPDKVEACKVLVAGVERDAVRVVNTEPVAPATLLPVAVGALVSAPALVAVTAEHVAANRYAAELRAADAAYQAGVTRDKLAAEAKALAASKGETGARLAKESRERAKVSAARVRAAKERGPSQSWADDVARLLERTAEDSIERLCVSVAWRMASKAVRRVEGGARKRSKAAARVETVAARFFGDDAGVLVDTGAAVVTTGADGATGADGWTGRAVQLSDTAKAEAFGAALEAAAAGVCGPVRLLASAPVGNFGTLCGIAYRAAFRSLTRLDGGGTGRKTGGESVVSADSESGAASVARWDAGRGIEAWELSTVEPERDARDGQLPRRLRGYGKGGGARFDTLPPVGLDAQRERASRSIAFRFGLINGGGAEGCDGCRALLGIVTEGAWRVQSKGKARNLAGAAQSRRAVAGALVSVLNGSEPETARARWGAGQSAFASALRSLGLAVSSDKRGLACA